MSTTTDKPQDDTLEKTTPLIEFYKNPTPGNAVTLAIADLETLQVGTTRFFAELEKAKNYDALAASHAELLNLLEVMTEDTLNTRIEELRELKGRYAGLTKPEEVELSNCLAVPEVIKRAKALTK